MNSYGGSFHCSGGPIGNGITFTGQRRLHHDLLRPAVGEGQKFGEFHVRFLLIPECR
jgi:hypothetical protein